MKRFEAFYKDGNRNSNLINEYGLQHAIEVKFDIIATDENRALELINQYGEDCSKFYLEETSGVKDSMGRYFSESIKDTTIK